MKRFVLIAIGLVALVAACTSGSGGHGSESNFFECKVDSDCPHGLCVDNRCEGDAAPQSGSTGGAAGQVGSTGGVSNGGSSGTGGLPSSGGTSGGAATGGTSAASGGAGSSGAAGSGGSFAPDAGGALCNRLYCPFLDGLPAVGCCLAQNGCGFDVGHGCEDPGAITLPAPDASTGAYLFPSECNLGDQAFPCHPWSNVGCVWDEARCVPSAGNEQSVACVPSAGLVTTGEPCTLGGTPQCAQHSGCSPTSMRCRPFCCSDSQCFSGNCVDMDPSTPSPFGYCED